MFGNRADKAKQKVKAEARRGKERTRRAKEKAKLASAPKATDPGATVGLAAALAVLMIWGFSSLAGERSSEDESDSNHLPALVAMEESAEAPGPPIKVIKPDRFVGKPWEEDPRWAEALRDCREVTEQLREARARQEADGDPALWAQDVEAMLAKLLPAIELSWDLREDYAETPKAAQAIERAFRHYETLRMDLMRERRH